MNFGSRFLIKLKIPISKRYKAKSAKLFIRNATAIFVQQLNKKKLKATKVQVLSSFGEPPPFSSTQLLL